MTAARPGTGEPKLGVRRLLGTRGFRRLLASRFAAQWGDGLFQTGLGGAVLFNPERQADPVAIALGLTVLLLPYSVLGPFAGALLDRWDRRQVLVVANLVRGVFIVATAVMVGAGVAAVPLYVGALLATGVSRFVNAGLSAAMPHLVRPRYLVEANAVATTIGAAVAIFGSGCAIVLREFLGEGNVGSAWTTGIGAVGSVLAALIAAGFARGRLGPDEVDEPAQPMVAVARGLADGGRAAWRVPTVAAGFCALAAHRIAFGISTLVALLLFRNTFTDQGVLRAGLPGLGQALALGAVGVVLAAVLTPLLVARIGRPAAVRLGLAVAAVAQLTFGLLMTLPAVLAAAFVLSLAGQSIKLSLDAEVQTSIGDQVRGRVFALYDTVFNVSYVVATVVAATLVPEDGQSLALMLVAGAVYVAGLVVYQVRLSTAEVPKQHSQ
ncbi:MAG TPA: MFS transporter [Pseudonocardiaceae bacterium]|nr:MFS transporter [Pseudonocardiaceae bacterium]